MVRTVIEFNRHRVDWVTSQWSIDHRLSKAFLNSRNEFAGDRSAYNIVYKLKTFFAILTWSDLKHNIGKLTATTRLLLVYFFMINSRGELFFVSHLRRTLIDLHFEFALHALDNNFEVKLAHPTKDYLTGFMVSIDAQCWIFFNQLSDGHAQFIRIRLLLRLDRITDNWLREIHRLQNYLVLFITKGIAS